MTTVQNRLQTLGLTLPPPAAPLAAYVPVVRTGQLLFVSGQVPLSGGELTARGPVPSACSLEDAAAAARLCVLNGLAAAAATLDGDLDRIRRVVRVGVFVASEPTFIDQPKVANGASELLQEIFGESGRHARAAVGSVSLPLGAAVEVEMVLEVGE